MMKVTLNRFHSSSDDTLGAFGINGRFSAFCIEDEYREVKVMGETRIPAGTYKLALVDSPKFSKKYGHKMIMLLNTPKFTGVLIHKGNSEKDTDACLCVGNVARFNAAGNSRVEESGLAYDRLYPIIAKAIETEGAEITITDSDR
jgi:hypothetical protein